MWELAGARAASVCVCVCMCVCVCSVWALECLHISVKVCHYVFMELLGGRGFSVGMACLAVHMRVCEPPPCPIKAEPGGPCSHFGDYCPGHIWGGGMWRAVCSQARGLAWFSGPAHKGICAHIPSTPSLWGGWTAVGCVW